MFLLLAAVLGCVLVAPLVCDACFTAAACCVFVHQAKDLVSRMLVVDIEKRATVAQILSHPVS